MKKMKSDNQCNYNLKNETTESYMYRDNKVCKTKRTEDFFTFKYFS